MSLLKGKELAKKKSELGNKINYVHNAITQSDIGKQTSQESFKRVFQPITTKLDDVVASNLRIPQRKRRQPKKGEVPDYGIDIEDEVGDMNLGDLFDQPVLPEQQKQIVPKPPRYEQSLKDVLKGEKEIYVDPQYLPETVSELPPEYDDDEVPDYEKEEEDLANETLDDIGVTIYENVEKRLNEPEMTPSTTRSYLNKILKDAEFKRHQLKALKGNITKQFNKGTISETENKMSKKRIDNAFAALNQYIQHYKTKVKTIKGSGIRKKKKGGNVMFFNGPKKLIKKLEVIIGEMVAGNTSIKMRNMGVAILDALLRTSAINKSQYNKLHKNYFKI